MALQRFGRKGTTPPAAPAREAAASADAPYSIEDAIAGFERLFDRAGLLKFLLDVAVESTGASNGSIMLYSPEAQELYIAHATGLSERVIRNTRQKLGEGISGAVAMERRGKLIRQAAVGKSFSAQLDRVNIGSACSVPLLDGDRLLGVLNVSSERDARELAMEDLHKLERVSARIARVLSQSIRMQELQVRAGEMQLRQSAGEIAEGTGSTAERFSLLASLVGEMCGAESVEVYVGTTGGDWLVLGGSSRRIATELDLVHVGRGVLSRAFLERRPLVLTEPVDPQSAELASSFAFVPLVLNDVLGVAVVEFSDRRRLDEFLSARNSISLELSRFIASERRERRLRAELASLARVSEAAPALVSCGSLEDLCEALARILADALGCRGVTVRLRVLPDDAWTVYRHDASGDPDPNWVEEDEDRFARLERRGEAFALSFVDFTPGQPRSHTTRSVLGVPVWLGEVLAGGVLAYDRVPETAVEDAAFGSTDETVVEQAVAMARPVLRALASPGADVRPSRDDVLAGNLHRLSRMIDAEMARADRYHHPFSLLVVKVPALADTVANDDATAAALAEEIHQGFRTRTRNSDFGCWIRRDSYALLSLEGTRRIKFLVSRLAAYLRKDLGAAGLNLDDDGVVVGIATYPGAARSADALLESAEQAARPYAGD
jgi:GAF domain-containing protein